MKKKTFVVIGLDRFGINLARNLQELGNEVICLDRDPEKAREIADEITHVVIGDATDKAVLRSLDLESVDLAVVSLTQDIQSGVLVTLLLKEMGVKQVISKCKNDIHKRILEKIGADRVIYPEKDSSERLAKRLTNTDIMEFIDLSDEFSIAELRIPREWIGKSLIELNVRAKYDINVIAIRDNNGEINLSVDPHKKFEDNYNIIVIGKNEKIEQIIEK